MSARRSFAWLGIVALALFFAVQVTGCSLIGLGIGSMMEASPPRSTMIPASEIGMVSSGQLITLHLKDSTLVHGRYVGTSRVSKEDYAVRYQAWRESHPAGGDLPAIGDSIRIIRRADEPLTETFAGFGFRYMITGSTTASGPGTVPFSEIVELSGPGSHKITGERLTALDVSGELPSVTALVLLPSLAEMPKPGSGPSGPGGSRTEVDRVARVEIPGSAGSLAQVGFLVGLAADVAIVIAISQQKSATPSSSGADCDPNPDSHFPLGYGDLYDVRTGTWLTPPRAANTGGAGDAPAAHDGEPAVN